MIEVGVGCVLCLAQKDRLMYDSFDPTNHARQLKRCSSSGSSGRISRMAVALPFHQSLPLSTRTFPLLRLKQG